MSVQSDRRWAKEQRQIYFMKLRIARWWSVTHPGPFPAGGGVISPEQLLAHLKEHFPNLFEDQMAQDKRSKMN
jgi:hypothetical protein